MLSSRLSPHNTPYECSVTVHTSRTTASTTPPDHPPACFHGGALEPRTRPPSNAHKHWCTVGSSRLLATAGQKHHRGSVPTSRLGPHPTLSHSSPTSSPLSSLRQRRLRRQPRASKNETPERSHAPCPFSLHQHITTAAPGRTWARMVSMKPNMLLGGLSISDPRLGVEDDHLVLNWKVEMFGSILLGNSSWTFSRTSTLVPEGSIVIIIIVPSD